MKTIEQTFRENLIRLRGKRTQAQIAEIAGIPTRSYQNAELNGVIPQGPNRQAIARALGVEELDLFVDPLRHSPSRDITVTQALEIVQNALSAALAPPPGVDIDDFAEIMRALRFEPRLMTAFLASASAVLDDLGVEDEKKLRSGGNKRG